MVKPSRSVKVVVPKGTFSNHFPWGAFRVRPDVSSWGSEGVFVRVKRAPVPKIYVFPR